MTPWGLRRKVITEFEEDGRNVPFHILVLMLGIPTQAGRSLQTPTPAEQW